MSVLTKIVKIGNSQGIRIPKALLEQVNLGEEVELVVDGNQLILRPAGNPRQGWEAAFADMSEQGDDAVLDGDIIDTDWDDQWEW